MNIEYGNSNSQPIIKFLPYTMGDPNAFSKSHDAEMINKFGRHDPLKPPRKERGDIYIILGAIIWDYSGLFLEHLYNISRSHYRSNHRSYGR
jgi:hypothetical protein